MNMLIKLVNSMTMRTLLLVSCLLMTLVGCQIDPLDILPQKSVVPDLNARVAKERIVSRQTQKVTNEYVYQYDNANRLVRVERFAINDKTPPTLYNYEVYDYTTRGQLFRRTSYQRNYSRGDYVPNVEYRYAYPEANRTLEQTYYYNLTTGVVSLQSWTETIREDGRVVRVDRYSPTYSNSVKPNFTGSTINRYRDGRLVTQEYRGDQGQLQSTHQWKYTGRNAEVMATYAGSERSFVYQALEYDRRGRVIRQTYSYGSFTGYQSMLTTDYMAIPTISEFEYVD
jgi:hypothetical protein